MRDGVMLCGWLHPSDDFAAGVNRLRSPGVGIQRDDLSSSSESFVVGAGQRGEAMLAEVHMEPRIEIDAGGGFCLRLFSS